MWKALVRPLYLSHLLMSYWPDQARAKLTVTAGRDLNSTSLKKKKKCHIYLPTLNPIFQLFHEACGILVPQSGMELELPAVEV